MTADKRSDIKRYIAERTTGQVPSERYLTVRYASQIAAQLEQLRERRGLTYDEVASRAGTSKAQVIRLMSGTYQGMSSKSLVKLAAALGARAETRFKPLPEALTAPPREMPAVAPSYRSGYGTMRAAATTARTRAMKSIR